MAIRALSIAADITTKALETAEQGWTKRAEQTNTGNRQREINPAEQRKHRTQNLAGENSALKEQYKRHRERGTTVKPNRPRVDNRFGGSDLEEQI